MATESSVPGEQKGEPVQPESHDVPQPLVRDGSEDDDNLELTLYDTTTIDSPRYQDMSTEVPKKPRHVANRMTQVINFFRPYWILDYLNYKSFRIVARTWVKAWVCALLTLITRSNVWLGQASFLVIIYSFIIPVGGFSIIISITFGVICVSFACIGWLVGVVAMAITNHIRGNKPIEYWILQAVMRGVCQANDPNLSQCFQTALFKGTFLDPSHSTIHAIAIFVSVTFFVFVKMKSKMFLFGGVVGLITSLICLTYQTYVPYWQPTQFGLIVVKPVGITFAFNVVAAVLIFPKTSSFGYIDSNVSILKVLHGMTKLHSSILAKDRPSTSAFDRYQKLQQTVATLKAKIPLLSIDGGALKLEVSYGRFDKAAAARFGVLLKHLLYQVQGFEIFYEYLHDCKELLEEGNQPLHEKSPTRQGPPIGAYEQQQHEQFYKHARAHITLQELDQVVDMIWSLFGPALQVADEAFDRLTQWLDAANQYRAYSFIRAQKHEKEQQEQAKLLKEARDKMLQAYNSISDEHWRDSTKDAFQQNHVLPTMVGQGCLFGFLTRQYIMSLSRMMELCINVDEQRPKPQFMFPWTKCMDLGIDTIPDDAEKEAPPKQDYRDPEADPPTNAAQKFGKKISTWHRALGDHCFITALRTGLLAVLFTMPVFFHTTAWWFYKNRLVWASVMVSLATFEYLGDTLYAAIANNCYTFMSCVLGLVGWYIGNGHGSGSPYGTGAVYGVMFVLLAYYRHFSEHLIPLPAIILCVTFVLVMGTSWNDGNYPGLTANIGWGWEPAWKRFVTVVVGLFGGCLASSLPKPFTVKKAIRVNLGQILTKLGKLHCDIGNFALSRARNADTHILLGSRDHVLGQLGEINNLLLDTRRKCRTVKYEPPLQGRWPQSKYLRLLKLQSDVLIMYHYLYAVFNQVEHPETRILQMIREYGWGEVSLNSDFMAVLHMCGSSLVTKSPLPMLTPAHTTLKHLHVLQKQQEQEQKNTPASNPRQRHHADAFDFSSDGRLSTAGHCLVECIYERIDEIALLSKELVGEQYSVDQYFFRPASA